jgi:X-X-X-Leu-X-X-Gly heptad repeat protein
MKIKYFGWFSSSCLGTPNLQAPACSLTAFRGIWSFKVRIPKLKLGNEQKVSEGAAKVSEGAAKVSQGAAKVSEGAAKVSQGVAKVSQGAAKVSQGAAKVSQGAANVSEGAAKVSQGAAKTSRLADNCFPQPSGTGSPEAEQHSAQCKTKPD